MTHIWGVHDMSVHRDNDYWAWLEQFQPRSIKLFEWSWNNKGYCDQLATVLSEDCLYIARDQPLSEQKADMVEDPAATGIRHANEWKKKWDEGRIHTPRDRTIHLGLNEVDTNHWAKEHAIYEENFAVHMRRFGLRAGLGSFGVGHPRTIDGTTQTARAWDLYRAVGDMLSAEDFHKLVAHEYGPHNGYGWGFWIGGIVFGCPWPLHDEQVIYGEVGVDEHTATGKGNQGFRYFLTPDQYIAWLLPVHHLLSADPRTHSALKFTYDFFPPWASFDWREMRELVLHAPWTMGNEQEILNFPTDTPVRINYVNGADFPKPNTVVHIPLVIDDNLDVKQQYPQDFLRAMEYILGIEGGFSNHPLDRGGITNLGISKNANPDVDVENLTVERALEIYWERYWCRSGASQWGWPVNYAIMDAAVQHGAESAKWMWDKAEHDLATLTARRLRLYNKQDEEQWDAFGHGWIERMAQVIERTL